MPLRLTGDWPTMRQLFNARGFQSRWKLNMNKYLKAMGIATQGLMTKIILRDKPFVENAALTGIIKQESTPLVQENDLVQSINWEIKGEQVFIGVLRGSGNFNVAAIVHEGATIPVTKKMRGYFIFLHSQNPKIKVLSPKTTKIIVPGRPFSKTTLEDPRLEPFVKKQAETLVLNALNPKSNVPFKAAI